MWMEKMIGVSKAENGFVVEVHIPFKPDKTTKKNDMPEPYHSGSEKQFIAKDVKGVVDLINKLLPMLDDAFSSEEQFDSAFNEAAGMKPTA